MITAHFPAGYVLWRGTARWRFPALAVLTGAVFPDLDLIWFYLIDNRQIHHHLYWVHIPGFWVCVAAIVLPLLYGTARHLLAPAIGFLAAVFLHICLDGIAGGIAWTWPLDRNLYHLVTVPPTRSHFLLSFLAHWTMLLELVVWITAITFWVRRRS